MKQPTLKDWETAHPGKFPSLIALREQAHFANTTRLFLQQNLQHVQDLAQQSATPLIAFPPAALKNFCLLQKQHATAQRDLIRAVDALIALPVPPPAPKKRRRPPSRILQTIRITTNPDGTVVTNPDITSARVCKVRLWEHIEAITRQFHFHNGIIPPSYDWVRFHDGEEFPPGEDWSITYSAREFKRLSKLEAPDPTLHFLDGARLGHYCHHDP